MSVTWSPLALKPMLSPSLTHWPAVIHYHRRNPLSNSSICHFYLLAILIATFYPLFRQKGRGKIFFQDNKSKANCPTLRKWVNCGCKFFYGTHNNGFQDWDNRLLSKDFYIVFRIFCTILTFLANNPQCIMFPHCWFTPGKNSLPIASCPKTSS